MFFEHARPLFVLVISFWLLPSTVFALDTFLIGPRATGMAGANVASVDNNSAQYYNPAAFGFFGRTTMTDKKNDSGLSAIIEPVPAVQSEITSLDQSETNPLVTKTETTSERQRNADTGNLSRKDWGFDIYAGGGYRLNNDMGQYLEELTNIDYEMLSQNGISTESDLVDLINIVSNLNGLDEPGTAISGDVNGGLTLRVKNFGIGMRGYAQAAGIVLGIDNTNIGLNSSNLATDNIATQINNISPSGYVADGTYNYFTSTQADSLISNLQTRFNATFADAQQAVDKLDYVASQQNTDPALAQQVTDTLGNLAPSVGTGAGALDNNTTTVLLTGFGVAEVPLTYGFAFNDHLSLGANLKWMRGRLYGNEVLVFDNDSGETLSQTDEHYNETNAIGLDLGFLARYGMFNFGITGRNLNSPEFDGFTYASNVTNADGSQKMVTVDSVTIEPQVTTGLAFIPHPTVTFEVDYDLTQNETIVKGYDTRNLAIGFEWDAFRVLALRLGAFKNLAEDDIGWVYTAGLGLNFWAMRLDIAGAMAAETVEFDGEDSPVESRIAAQISVDF